MSLGQPLSSVGLEPARTKKFSTVLPSREERIRRSAHVLERLLPGEIAVLRDCDENALLNDEELAAASLVELVVEELGAEKSDLYEYYDKEMSKYGIRMLKASFNQLDRVTAEFYARAPAAAILYCARIWVDIQDVIEREIDGLQGRGNGLPTGEK
jgi:hypothetical protein